MEFITEGDTVKCVRVISGAEQESRVTVATFHVDVDRVAPHVAASLAPEEISELELWLRDRTNLQEALEERPIEITILDTLPEVLDQATNAINELGELNKEIYQSIRDKISLLTCALDKIDHLETETKKVKLKKMPKSEVLKERLGAIKDNLEK